MRSSCLYELIENMKPFAMNYHRRLPSISAGRHFTRRNRRTPVADRLSIQTVAGPSSRALSQCFQAGDRGQAEVGFHDARVAPFRP